MRKIHAPEASVTVEGHGFENEPARYTPRHSRLDHLPRREVLHGTPRDGAQRGISVAVLPVGPTTDGESERGELPFDVRPNDMEMFEFGTRPRKAEELVEGRTEILLHLILDGDIEQVFRDDLRDGPQGLDGICFQGTGEATNVGGCAADPGWNLPNLFGPVGADAKSTAA